MPSNVDPSENMNDTGDETLDLSAPLLLRSESDEGIKDWFEDDGYKPEDQVSSDNTVQYVEEKLLVLVVSIMNILQWGFLVGAFFVPWIDTNIDVDVTGYWNDSLKTSLPLHKNLSLCQFLSLIIEKLPHFYRILIYGTTFALPSFATIFNTCFIVIYIRRLALLRNRTSDPTGPMRTRDLWLKRDNERVCLNGMELVSKYQLLVFYIVLINVSITSTIQLTTEKRSSQSSSSNEFLTTCSVFHTMRGGMISYILAVSTGTLALFFLRILFEKGDRTNSNDIISDEPINNRSNSTGGFRSPPISAFKKIPWKDSHLHQDAEDEVFSGSYDNSSPGLDVCSIDERNLETNPAFSHALHTLDQSLENTELKYIRHDAGKIGHEKNPMIPHRPKAVPTTSSFGLSDILRFEVCILAIILWVPILTLPVFHLRAQGVFSYLMDPSYIQSATVNVWDILGLLMKSGGPTLFNMVSLLFLIHQIIICPVLLVSFYLAAWYREELIGNHPRSSKKLWAHFTYLSASTIPFVIGTILVINNMGSLSEGLLNQSYLCGKLLRILNFISEENQKCLIIEARIGAGLYFLLVEGLCLEILFIIYMI